MYRNSNSMLTRISRLFASGSDIRVVFDKVASKEEIVRTSVGKQISIGLYCDLRTVCPRTRYSRGFRQSQIYKGYCDAMCRNRNSKTYFNLRTLCLRSDTLIVFHKVISGGAMVRASMDIQTSDLL